MQSLPSVTMDSNLNISQKTHLFQHASSLVYDRKFDVAMRQTQIERFLKRLETGTSTFDDFLILDSRTYDPELTILYDPDLFARILQHLMTKAPFSYGTSRSNSVDQIVDLVRSNTSVQVRWNLTTITIPSWHSDRLTKLKSFLNYHTLDPMISLLLQLATEVSQVIDTLSEIDHPKYHNKTMSTIDRRNMILKVAHASLYAGNLKIAWSRSLCLVNLSGRQYVLPRSYILLIHNKLCDLISCLVLASYSTGTTQPSDALIRIRSFIETMIALILQYKNQYFEISKTIEALCYAETIRKVEAWKNVEFINELHHSLEDSLGFHYLSSDLCLLLRSADDPFRHELACLSKILGHPLVSMEGGSISIHKKTTEVYTLDYTKLAECECYIKENYIRNYILAKKTWPPHHIASSCTPIGLRTASRMNVDPNSPLIVSKYPKVQILDYLFIELLPSLEFNALENMIPHLKDKTLSLCRSKIVSQLLNEAEHTAASWKETRLLLAYLLNPAFVTDHMAYLDGINSDMPLEHFLDYLVLRIVPKEKEHKVDFRGFGCKTYHDRARSLIQEKNAMHYLDLFSDEQAMTLSELDLVNRLYSFRNLKDAYAGHEVLFVVLDASSWNNHFRKETVDDLMVNTLDKVFNHKLFGKTHQFYQKSLFYVPDGEETYHWDGQAGGIEGLNQDTWVIVYISQIKTALTHMNLKYHILCKGDDFRLAILIPTKNLDAISMKEYKKHITVTVSEAAKQMGHVIKVSESFGSERYFMFSKSAFIGNVEMPQTFRKIFKAYGANNSFITTIDEYIASTYSNAHSACKVSPCALAQYMVALFWTYYYLLQDKNYSKLSNNELVALTLVPSMLGGFPIIYLHNMYVRAESDLLPPFLHLLSFCKSHYPALFQTMKEFCLLDPDPSQRSFVQLYKDPYSIPSPRPRLPSAVLRKQIIPALIKLVRNENIAELMAARDSEEQRTFEEILATAKPKNIKILSRVYGATPSAIVDQLVKKFESARSILELLVLKMGHRRTNHVLRKVALADRVLQQWRYHIVTRQSFCEFYNFYQKCYSTCPTEFADNIRTLGWGEPIIGITSPPMQHLMSFTSMAFATQEEMFRHFTYEICDDLKFENRAQKRYYASGTYKPFLGYITKTASSTPQLKFITKDVILTQVTSLLEIHGWSLMMSESDDPLIEGSNFYLLIEKLLKLYTNLPLEKLRPYQNIYKGGGTEQHHIRAPKFREGIMPNVSPNLYTQFTGCSDTHRMFKNNNEHYMVNYLYVYCYAHSIIFGELDTHPDLTCPKEVWGVTVDCDYCLEPIRSSEQVMTIKTTNLRRIRFTPLVSTNIGSIMKTILSTSLRENEGKKYIVNAHQREISAEEACKGVMAHLIKITTDSRQGLQDRYTGHWMDDKSRQLLLNLSVKTDGREIGQTELRLLPAKIIARCLVPVIGSLILDHLHLIGKVEHSYALHQLPTSELGWTVILRFLYDADRLMDVVIALAELAGCSSVYSGATPNDVAYLVGNFALTALFKSKITDDVMVVIVGTEPNDLRLLAHRYVTQWSWCWLYQQYVVPFQATGDLHWWYKGIVFTTLRLWAIETLTTGITMELLEMTMKMTNLFEFELDDLCFYEDPADLARQGALPLHHYNQLCRKRVKMADVDHINDNYETLFDEVMEEMGDQYLRIKIVVLMSAIKALRQGITAEDLHPLGEINARETIPTVKLLATDPPLFYTPKQTQSLKKIPPTLPDDMTTAIVPIWNPTYDVTIRRIYWEYQDRPYGNQTNTINALLEIYKSFKYFSNASVPNLYISELGGGYGGGTCFFAHMHHGSQIIFSTKPTLRGKLTAPVFALNQRHITSAKIIFEHIANDLYDLRERRVLEYFAAINPTNHIIFCDVDYMRPKSDEIFAIWSNCIWYYLKTRVQKSVIILKLSLDCYRETAMIINHLSKLCRYTYIIQPKSARCYYTFYVVAWERNIEHMDTEISANWSLAIDQVLTAFYKYSMRMFTSKYALDYEISFSSAIIYGPDYSDRLPSYFLSLLSSRLYIDLEDDVMRDLTARMEEKRMTGRQLCREFWEIKKPSIASKIHSFQTQLKRLDIQIVGNVNVDGDFHARRVHLLNVMFICYGIHFFCSKLKGTNLGFSMRNARRYYVKLCTELDVRDKRVLPTLAIDNEELFAKEVYFQTTANSELLRIPWWSNYCHGIEIGLSSVGYFENKTISYRPVVRYHHEEDRDGSDEN